MATLATWLRTFGFDPKRTLSSLRGICRYWQERRAFRAGLAAEFEWGRDLPILDERTAASGNLGVYFYQDDLVARWIYASEPVRHVDVGSRIDGFIGHLSVFRHVEVLDIRPLPHTIRNVTFHQLDLMEQVPDHWVESTPSLSCLHTIEHFGLGRYGDSIDPDGHLKGLAQLKRMVEPGGLLYLSTPIGTQRIEFNAHRIFSAGTLLEWFKDGWTIEKFAYIDDSGNLHDNIDPETAEIPNHLDCQTALVILAIRKT